MEKVEEAAGAVTGGVRALLRVEGIALAGLGLAGFVWSGEPWWMLVVLLLAPDVSFLGYLAGPRVGAVVYNGAHTTVGPLVLVAAGMGSGVAIAASLGFIWLAHIGIDRGIGYGLKYAAGFGFTHVGRIGRP